jgi:drug/metabolite transporter (DMT)-like permease
MSTPDPYSQQPQQPQQPPPPPPYAPYPPQYGYMYPPPQPTNGMAIAAMVCGIVGVCSPLGILGLIFGTIAKRQIRERGEQGDGMATAGIVLGWIGVASIVFWILYFVFIFGILGTALNRMDVDDWPTDDPTWAIGLLSAIF